MAQLTVTPITTAGVSQTLVAAGVSGDSFTNTGKQQFAIVNAGGGSITVTFQCNGGDGNNKNCNFGLAAHPGHDLTVTVPNDSAVHVYGPFPTYMNDGSAQLQVRYSAVTSVTVNPFALPPSQ